MKRIAFISLCSAFATTLPVWGQSALNQFPTRVVGQGSVQVKNTNPNVVEGREFLTPWSVAVDRSSNPPGLYVSDTGNNRVLGWRNATAFQNGAVADIVLGQVDKSTTFALGPTTTRTSGLFNPGGLAVDAQGNVYVVDSGNNRILRFPKPFADSEEVKLPDMVIGQTGTATRDPNAGGISARTIATASGGAIGRNGLAFDAAGNLWFTDPLNNRVLRYPASALASGANAPAADLVLGQASFTGSTLPASDPSPRANKSTLRSPSSLVFDQDGRLYVADDGVRVLVFLPPFTTGKAAARIVGIGQQPDAGQQPEPIHFATTEYTLGNPRAPVSPEGVFVVGNRPGVVDTGNNRVVIYDPFAQWPAESERFPSPPAKAVIGQQDFSGNDANAGQAEPNNATLNGPLSATFHGTELYVADSFNHRVLVYPQQVTGATASRVLGQENFSFASPNTTEGKELFLFNGFSSGGNFSGDFSDGSGVAVDNRSNPPRLYIADTFNNRILAYRDARRVKQGDKADLVIGQNDFNRTLINAPQGNREVRTESGLYRPSGLAVDSQGNLWVADSGNARVLRFPSPFAQTIGTGQRHRANLVIGQTTFTQRNTDPSPRTMAYPFGIAFTVDGHLVLSDAVHHRILLFRKPEGADFVNGQTADRVFGQSDFFTGTRGVSNSRLFSPRHLSLDTDDRLYVADAGNNRVAIYDRITTAANDAPPALTLTGFSSPQGVFVSHRTGELWVANTRGNRAVRYPQANRLAQDGRPDYEIVSNTPLALVEDQFGNMVVAEGINRVALYYNGLAVQSAGNYSVRPLSPGMIAVLYPRGQGITFGSETKSFNEQPNPLPLPKDLADVQVLLDDQPVPMYFVSPGQLNFYVPMNAPTGGIAELQVVRPSTGQILASGFVEMARVSPALFVQGGAESGQLAALNEDGTVNDAGNPISRGKIIVLFGTGQGFVTGAPADGTVPTGQVPTDEKPTVIINNVVPDDHIIYSGLAPSLVGVWQLNVRVPMSVPPGAQIDVVAILRSVPSNRGSRNQIVRTTIAVKE